MRTNSPLLMAGVVLTLMSPLRSHALQVNSGISGAPRRLSASQLSGLHGLAATLMERNPSLAAGIAAGHVRVDTRSIRTVDALSDTLLSNSYVYQSYPHALCLYRAHYFTVLPPKRRSLP